MQNLQPLFLPLKGFLSRWLVKNKIDVLLILGFLFPNLKLQALDFFPFVSSPLDSKSN